MIVDDRQQLDTKHNREKKQERAFGFNDGARWIITRLHRRSGEMNDPHAKAVLNSAAFQFGNDLAAIANKKVDAAAAQGWHPTHRHKKRGTEYIIVGNALLQTDAALFDMTPMVIYRGSDGCLWARSSLDFYDGRFEIIAATQPPEQEVDDGFVDWIMPDGSVGKIDRRLAEQAQADAVAKRRTGGDGGPTLAELLDNVMRAREALNRRVYGYAIPQENR